VVQAAWGGVRGEQRIMDEAMALQIKGVEAAMMIYDWRYPTSDDQDFWILTLWGGLEIRIMAPTSEAIKLEKASEAQGDDALWIIRAA
jgi:hypothetical protein